MCLRETVSTKISEKGFFREENLEPFWSTEMLSGKYIR